MRRIAFTVVALLLSSSIPVPPATAAAPGKCGDNRIGDAIDCEGDSQAVIQVTFGGIVSRQGGPASTSSGPTKKYVPYNRLGTGLDGQPCATTGYVEEGVTPADERLLVDPNPQETNIPITGTDLAILETYPPCPEQPRVPGQSAPVDVEPRLGASTGSRAGT